MNLTITPSPLSGVIPAIPSKSRAHRLLICAALAKTSTALDCQGTSRDIEATAACLSAMGAAVCRRGGGFAVTPGPVQSPCALPCGESGSTLRFLLPVAAALGLDAVFRMEGRLSQRPLAPLDRELEAHGAALSRPEPDALRCTGQLRPGAFTLPGNVSSQYISGLLFALPLLDRPSTLTVTGAVESAPYIAMTLDALRQFGVEVMVENQVYHIPACGYQSPGRAAVEGDWSNAAFWLCAGALGRGITVTGLDSESLQGDKAVFDLLARFGAKTKPGFTASAGSLRPLEIDAAAIPDLVPVLSVVAAAAPGTTRIYNAGRLRLKESDRIETVWRLLTNLGADAEQTADGLLIHGGRPLTGGTVDSCNDHRIAMAAAVASTLCTAPVTVLNAGAVSKSYPGFWEDFERLGGKTMVDN